MSLDGYIADEDGGHDWIVMDPDIDFAAFTAKIDTLIMGRGTYALAEGGDATFGMGDMKVYVVSTTLDPADHPDVTVIATDVEETVAQLKAEQGKDIWLFGGGVLFRSLLEAGLVDRVEVGVIPVLLGSGIPLLPGLAGIATHELHSIEKMPKSGIVLLKYDVVNERD
jgi:dihydrofolate reductase